jgi:hypothetical protein
VVSRDQRVSHRPLSRLRRQLPARRGATQVGAADSIALAVPRSARPPRAPSPSPALRGTDPRSGSGGRSRTRRRSNSRGQRVSHRPLSRLRRQLPARRGAAQVDVADSSTFAVPVPETAPRTFAVPRLAGDRSAQRIRGSVSDSAAFELARPTSQPPTPQSPAATAPRKAGSDSGIERCRRTDRSTTPRLSNLYARISTEPQRDSLVFGVVAAGRSPPAIAPVLGSVFGPGF